MGQLALVGSVDGEDGGEDADLGLDQALLERRQLRLTS